MWYAAVIVVLFSAFGLGLLGAAGMAKIVERGLGINGEMRDVLSLGLGGLVAGAYLLLMRSYLGRVFKRCGECQSHIPRAATRCRYCRSDKPDGA